jgi:hypothetical protein
MSDDGGNEEAHSRQLFDLVRQQTEFPSEDPASDVHDQFLLYIQQTLGANLPAETTNKLLDIQGRLYRERGALEDMVESGQLTEDEYFERAGVVVRASADEFRRVLTDDQYEKLLGLKPDENPAGVLMPPPEYVRDR